MCLEAWLHPPTQSPYSRPGSPESCLDDKLPFGWVADARRVVALLLASQRRGQGGLEVAKDSPRAKVEPSSPADPRIMQTVHPISALSLHSSAVTTSSFPTNTPDSCLRTFGAVEYQS